MANMRRRKERTTAGRIVLLLVVALLSKKCCHIYRFPSTGGAVDPAADALLPFAAALLGVNFHKAAPKHRSRVPSPSHVSLQSLPRTVQESAAAGATTIVATETGKDALSSTLDVTPQLVLLSLQWTNTESTSSVITTSNGDWNNLQTSSTSQRSFSKTVADVWRWKDAVLGDGRDFFVPKPKTLQALQQYLVQSVPARAVEQQDVGNTTDASNSLSTCRDNTTSPLRISECVVLSNCARFEILIVLDPPNDPSSTLSSASSTASFSTDTVQRLVSHISRKLLHQVASHQYDQKQAKLSRQLWSMVPQVDWPGVIDGNADGHLHIVEENGEAVAKYDELSRHWNVLMGPEDVSRHLCCVAAGLAVRPKRLDRTVQFRPFSSRDAHILCQLKRTYEIASSTSTATAASGSRSQHESASASTAANNPMLSMVLRLALQAGKAARNPEKVPLLHELRRHYGETGNSKKFDVEPPATFIHPVEQQVHQLAIEPAVEECVWRWEKTIGRLDLDNSDNTSQNAIAKFRECALALAHDGSTAAAAAERQYILKRLHAPTVQMREGKLINETHFLETLRKEINVMRQ